MVVNPRELLLLARAPGVGPHRLRLLVNHFKDCTLIQTATPRELSSVNGIDRRTALSIVRFFRSPSCDETRRSIDQHLSRLLQLGGRLITEWDSDYPSNLRRIYDPPPYLFVRGGMTPSDDESIAIVGTRHPTAYGTERASRFAAGLCEVGIPVVSGLARGIDTVVHRTAINKGGRTVAVIGSGIDVIYPPENKPLVERLLSDGALLSEFDMETKPDAGNFPRRNRVISGMALATVVVETGVDGGAMITARMALDQNRDVFAVPSAVSNHRKSGTNLLIKQGKAALVETVEDVLTELAPRLTRILRPADHRVPLPPPPVTIFERTILDVLSETPLHIDSVAERANLSPSDTLVHLLSLEFKGLIRQLPGKLFSRT